MASISYKCPYCGRDTTATDPHTWSDWNNIWLGAPSDLGAVGLRVDAVSCPNPECKKLRLKIALTKSVASGGNRREGAALASWSLLPESEARVLPDYIPMPISEDYLEACRIRDLSPKASATLARRCLQGMIRDFWGVRGSTLKEEIDAIQSKVDTEVWDAIHAVRSVGNIGAHMERDINLIVEVERDEAQLLIGLIEQLIDEWYVARKQRAERMAAVTNMAARKREDKKPQPAQ